MGWQNNEVRSERQVPKNPKLVDVPRVQIDFLEGERMGKRLSTPERFQQLPGSFQPCPQQ